LIGCLPNPPMLSQTECPHRLRLLQHERRMEGLIDGVKAITRAARSSDVVDRS